MALDTLSPKVTDLLAELRGHIELKRDGLERLKSRDDTNFLRGQIKGLRLAITLIEGPEEDET